MLENFTNRKPNRKRILINSAIMIIGMVVFVFVPALIFRYRYETEIFSVNDLKSTNASYTYGIVFGAGTRDNGQPNLILKDRLDTAIDLYTNGNIDKIVLSGANDEDHDEVDVMSAYIINNTTIKPDDLILDGYGMRTFDTCRRATEVYEIDRAILITSDYHLPRSLYLCQDSGMDSIGVGSTRHMYISGSIFVLREVLATQKALIDTLLFKPEYKTIAY